MNVRQLRAFLALADTLSFAEAANRVHLSQPALSLSIKGLEQSLGGPLLTRTTRSVRLTPEGELLVPLARRLLADWDNTEELLSQHFSLQMGKVLLAAMPSFAGNCLPAALRVFRERHPRVNVAVHDVVNEQVQEMVRDHRVELGIGFEPEAEEGLQFEPLFLDRFVAVVPGESPLAARSRISGRELLAEPFITLQRPSAVRLLIERELAREGLATPVAFECHQLVTVGRMVASGLGVSIVPALCTAPMTEQGAAVLALEGPRIERRVGLIRHGARPLSRAARAMAEVLAEQAAAGICR
ncbi:LysR family transcriptional regulator [Stutzerimonas tarimensis]|uniref:LysR family transcriptional regulator n=1 Tax=Stutzerimonas tarimensis TaxID=1507735 RepID=A0ABV7T2H4_9GAMM